MCIKIKLISVMTDSFKIGQLEEDNQNNLIFDEEGFIFCITEGKMIDLYKLEFIIRSFIIFNTT